MDWRVEYRGSIQEDLEDLSHDIAERILAKVEGHLARAPASLGKRMSGRFAGLRTYRVGDHRVIFRMDEGKRVLRVLRVGHRSRVYRG